MKTLRSICRGANLVIWVICLLTGLLTVSQPIKAQCTIVYQSQDLMNGPDSTSEVSAVESRGALSKYLIVRYVHNRRKLVPKKAVWGYIDKYRNIWRSYDKELFLVIKCSGGWIEYVIDRPVKTKLTASYKAVMYSRTLDSKIESNWSKAMADAPFGFIVR